MAVLEFDAKAVKARRLWVAERERTVLAGAQIGEGKILMTDLFFAFHVDDPKRKALHGFGGMVGRVARDTKGAFEDEIKGAAAEASEL